MVLGLVPRERLCVTPRARLGFHAAWFPDMARGRVISAQHTKRLHDLYPEPARTWIARRGGLSAHTIVLEGRELRALLRPLHGGCGVAAHPAGRPADRGDTPPP